MIITLIIISLLQTGGSTAGRFEDGYYTTCPATREIRGIEDMFAGVEESELLRLAKSKPIAKCPNKDCGKQTVHVDITVHQGNVDCANAKDGPPELQKAAVETAMQMKFKKTNSKPFKGITGILKFEFH